MGPSEGAMSSKNPRPKKGAQTSRSGQAGKERTKITMAVVPNAQRPRAAGFVPSFSGPAIRGDAENGVDYICPTCGRTLLENIAPMSMQVSVTCFDCKTTSIPPI